MEPSYAYLASSYNCIWIKLIILQLNSLIRSVVFLNIVNLFFKEVMKCSSK